MRIKERQKKKPNTTKTETKRHKECQRGRRFSDESRM